MLQDRTRRLELGKTLLDAAKYTLTIVVAGGLLSSRRPDNAMIIVGLILTFTLGIIGFIMIPEEEETP